MTGLEPDNPLSEDQLAAVLDTLASKIVERRLECPAMLFLEMHRPLSFITSQGLVVALPLIGPLIGAERVVDLSRFLRYPANIDLLIARIEKMAAERDLAVSSANNRS